MGIYLDNENNRTVCVCNTCGVTTETNIANGVVSEDWGTGQIWIDVSLSHITQAAICFCPTCFEAIKPTKNFAISPVAA